MKEFKIDAETAESEIERFAEAMDLDLDTSKMDEEDRKAFDQQKRVLTLSIQKGNLIINDKGEPVFTPTMGDNLDPLTFYEPDGASFMTMDKMKKNADVAKMFGIMADMTKTHSKVFAKMKNRDSKVCQAIVTLFLG